MYSSSDRDNIKIFKYHQEESRKLSEEFDDANRRLAFHINESEVLLRKLGYNPSFVKNRSEDKLDLRSDISTRSYDQILQDANNSLGSETEYSFEDILSSKEITDACRRVDEINKEFSKMTRLSRIDLSFLLLSTALQTAKSIFLPAIGESFNSNERLSHNDPSIEKEHKQTLNDMRDKHYSNNTSSEAHWDPKKNEVHRKSWIEILYTKAPYDKIKGSKNLGLNLSGTNHRLKTLGHDPILGWIFGTANFMTDTATLSNFDSYRIRDAKWSQEAVSLPQLFNETVDLTMYDWHCLCAALVAQGAHLKSDEYTKMGLPIPFLSTFNEEWASKLYSEHYDSLCLQRDLKIIATSAIISIFINMIISFIHGMFYNPRIHGLDSNIYEIKTRKILILSNTLATSSNIIYCCITKNPHKLDIGGLLVTLSRLFLDIRFITKIKDEFIQHELDKDLYSTLVELENL